MNATLSPQEIVERGDALYAAQIRDHVEPEHEGRYLILDVATGDYEVDDDDMAAQERIEGHRPGGVFYGLRVGSPSTYFMGRHRR